MKKEGKKDFWEKVYQKMLVCFKGIRVILGIIMSLFIIALSILFASANINNWYILASALCVLALHNNEFLYFDELLDANKYKEFCIALILFLIATILRVVLPLVGYTGFTMVYRVIQIIILARAVLGNRDIEKNNSSRIAWVVIIILLLAISRGILFFSPVLD